MKGGEIKQCPFCGCKRIAELGSHELYLTAEIHCTHCGANFRKKNLPGDSGMKRCIANWNFRTQEQSLRKMYRALKVAVEGLEYWHEGELDRDKLIQAGNDEMPRMKQILEELKDDLG